MNHQIDPKTGERQVSYYNNYRSENGLIWWEWILFFALLTIIMLFLGIIFINILMWIFTLWINCLGWLIHFFNS